MAADRRSTGGGAAEAEWVATCSADTGQAGAPLARPAEDPAAPSIARVRNEANADVPHRRRWSDALEESAGPGVERFFNVRPQRQQWKSMLGVLSAQTVDSARVIREALAYFDAPRAMRKILDETVDGLVRTSLRAQQISRLASGRVRPQKEHVSLDRLVMTLLEQRRPDWKERGIEVRPSLQQAEVLTDPSGVLMMLDALLDWAAMRRAPFELAVESARWPAPATIRLRLPPPESPAPIRARRLDDGLHLPLAMQVASWLDVRVLCQENGPAADLEISFPQTYRDDIGLSTLELLDVPADCALSGWVLVLAPDDELRSEAVHVLSGAGIVTRGVSSCAEAAAMFNEGAPSVLVAGSDVPQQEFAALSRRCLTEARKCALVEITRGKPTFPDSGFAEWQVPRVGLAMLEKELAATVLFELARVEAGF
jgi:hypothetical protein